MSGIETRMRRAVVALVAVSATTLAMQSPALADEDEDDFEIPRVCFAKPWLPVCDPVQGPEPPPQDPFPCDFLASGCPWWMFD